MSHVPALLTVSEAARILRIGRTCAYGLAAEFRASGGQTGLPVIELGKQLRVPRARLEMMLGAPIESIPTATGEPVRSDHVSQPAA